MICLNLCIVSVVYIFSHTRETLKKENCPDNVKLFLESHTERGDHAQTTRAKTSLAAVRAALPILKIGGLLSLCIYSGQDTGFEECDTLPDFLQTLDSRKYLVLKTDYFNRPNHPPIPVFVIRQK